MKFDTGSIDIMSRFLYQSEACIVVNKLTGEAAQQAAALQAAEGARDRIVNLPEILKTHLKHNFIEAVNRLDVPVTGCSLFAMNSLSVKYLNAVFARETSDSEKERIKKIYWAVVEKPSFALPEKGELIHWIETDTRLNKSFAHETCKDGCKKAVLKYRTAGEGKNYLFLEVNLLTGRHHQIRSQFAASGLHIKGDLKYGAKRSEEGGGIRLHARYLSFPNPLKKDEIIHVTADPPVIDNLWEEFLHEQ